MATSLSALTLGRGVASAVASHETRASSSARLPTQERRGIIIIPLTRAGRHHQQQQTTAPPAAATVTTMEATTPCQRPRINWVLMHVYGRWGVIRTCPAVDLSALVKSASQPGILSPFLSLLLRAGRQVLHACLPGCLQLFRVVVRRPLLLFPVPQSRSLQSRDRMRSTFPWSPGSPCQVASRNSPFSKLIDDPPSLPSLAP